MEKLFSEVPCYGTTVELEHDGFALSLSIEHDDTARQPWRDEDGHGPVTDWERRDKRPGELVLCHDHDSYLFYDFAEACRIALRDGWGFLPWDLKTEEIDGDWRAMAGPFVSGVHSDINAAIREVYAAHRATFPSARAYAAGAARADFDRLKAFCDDEWTYIGVVVTASRNGVELGRDSLWGIESDCEEFILDCASDVAAQAVSAAREALASLCDCEEA